MKRVKGVEELERELLWVYGEHGVYSIEVVIEYDSARWNYTRTSGSLKAVLLNPTDTAITMHCTGNNMLYLQIKISDFKIFHVVFNQYWLHLRLARALCRPIFCDRCNRFSDPLLVNYHTTNFIYWHCIECR